MKNSNDQEIIKKFNDIDKLFNKISDENREELENARIKPIHPSLFPYSQNGIIAFIAPMGAGKSYNYLKLASKQQVIFSQPFYELVVICSTSSKFDKTVKNFKSSITKSKLVPVKDTDLLDFLDKYLRRVLKYNAINEFIKSRFKEANDEILRLIFKHKLKFPTDNRKDRLKIAKYITDKLSKYAWETFPHRMLLILDDFASHQRVERTHRTAHAAQPSGTTENSTFPIRK